MAGHEVGNVSAARADVECPHARGGLNDAGERVEVRSGGVNRTVYVCLGAGSELRVDDGVVSAFRLCIGHAQSMHHVGTLVQEEVIS
jgi:hypothetical protein